MLQRHRSLDVRSLLEQDLLLLRDLCLSPAAAEVGLDAAISGSSANEDGTGNANSVVSISGGGEGDVVADCWRLHVCLLMHVLGRVPAAADDSLAVVEHVALPCLETLAAACLDGVVYPTVQQDFGSNIPGTRGTATVASAAIIADTTIPNRQLGQALLCQVLRSSAEAWTSDTSEGTGACDGVLWRTPVQARNATVARRARDALVSSTPARSTRRRPTPPTPLEAEAQEVVTAARLPSRFPEHWLLRLLANRQSSVLGRFSGLVLGALATSNGTEFSEEMAEVAAHVLGCVGAEGSEPAALQVILRI